VFTDFTGPGMRGVYTPDRVAIEDEDGAVLREHHGPRESYPVRGHGTRWDPLHALYFGGYGMWNYLTTPHLLTLPGVRTEELEPWQAEGERRAAAPGDFSPVHRHPQHRTDLLLRRIGAAAQARLRAVRDGQPAGRPPHGSAPDRVRSGVPDAPLRTARPGRPLGPEPAIIVDFTDITVDFSDGPRPPRGGRE
jgi:hypothetical protein